VVAFVAWEWKGPKVPMIPRELFAGQRIVGMAFLIAFVAGMYYYALINFFPIVYESVYNPDPVQVGLKGLGLGFSVTFGAVLVNAALSLWKGHNRELLLASAVLMSEFYLHYSGLLCIANNRYFSCLRRCTRNYHAR
jgi:hypothetical protein